MIIHWIDGILVYSLCLCHISSLYIYINHLGIWLGRAGEAWLRRSRPIASHHVTRFKRRVVEVANHGVVREECGAIVLVELRVNGEA